jgi:hypothetical protein
MLRQYIMMGDTSSQFELDIDDDTSLIFKRHQMLLDFTRKSRAS